MRLSVHAVVLDIHAKHTVYTPWGKRPLLASLHCVMQKLFLPASGFDSSGMQSALCSAPAHALARSS